MDCVSRPHYQHSGIRRSCCFAPTQLGAYQHQAVSRGLIGHAGVVRLAYVCRGSARNIGTIRDRGPGPTLSEMLFETIRHRYDIHFTDRLHLYVASSGTNVGVKLECVV